MQMRRAVLAIGLLWLGACSDDPMVGQAVQAVQCIPGEAVTCSCGQGMPPGQAVCRDGGAFYGMCECGQAFDQAEQGGPMGAAPMGPGVQVPPGQDPPPAQQPMQPAVMPPVQDLPAQDPPAQDPPANDPPANDPLVEDPPVEDPPEEDPNEEDPVEAGPGIEVPASEHCAAADNWDPEWSAFEDRVLELTNQNRAAGAVCGGQPQDPVGPLTMSPALRCSSRLHAKDMADLMYFDHTSADGRTFDERINQAGYMGWTIGENIAQGQSSPEQVVQGWMDSPGHCVNIMNGGFTEIGIGYFAAEGGRFGVRPLYWVQNFGAPRPAGGGGWGR